MLHTSVEHQLPQTARHPASWKQFAQEEALSICRGKLETQSAELKAAKKNLTKVKRERTMAAKTVDNVMVEFVPVLSTRATKLHGRATTW